MPAASTASLKKLPTLEVWIEAAVSRSTEVAMTEEDDMNRQQSFGGEVKGVVCGAENGVNWRGRLVTPVQAWV